MAANNLPSAPGLFVAFRAGADPGAISMDSTVLPSVALYVPADGSATPFLRPGPFQAVWSGAVSAELRGEYRFQAELRGRFRLELNGTQVLETVAPEPRTELSTAVRLNKGTNLLVATFDSPTTGDSFLRLSWIPKGGWSAPIPPSALSHRTDATGLQEAEELHLGRQLVFEFRCVQCHSGQPGGQLPPESAMDAPSFEGIGSRRSFAWMAQWIYDPNAHRSRARMPRVFSTNALSQAQAAAAFLSTLQEPLSPSNRQSKDPTESTTLEAIAQGKQLFENLHCAACHDSPGSAQSDPERVSLRAVALKFPAGKLADFLRHPERDYSWIRMPNFKLSEKEAGHLSAYLTGAADTPKLPPIEPTPELARQGQKLVQTSGCLNCHSLKLANQFATKPLHELPAARWQEGCLAPTASSDTAAPRFAFSHAERAALQALARTDRAALLRDAPIDFAARHLRELRCAECHGKFEGFPSLDQLHGKLKPEWMQRFISGESPERPRPWLPARMPAFPKYADSLARGLTMLNGYPPQSTPEPPIDQAAALIGQKLVGADGGFICVSCHAVGSVAATQVFENAGVNLAHSSARLLKNYYERWVRNPLAIDPVSKMPVFFDEELHSPLQEFYDGDGAKQIEAIWQYLRLGDKMPPPATAAKEAP